MGSWSESILGNDDSMSIVEGFEAKMNEGIEKELIADLMIKENFYQINDEPANGKVDCKLALASVCWSYGVLTPEMLNEAVSLVRNGEDYSNWVMNEDEIENRKDVLTEFIEKISTPCIEVEQNETRLKRIAISEKIEDLLRDLCNLNDVDTLRITSPKSIKIFVDNQRKGLSGGAVWEMNDDTYGFELVEAPKTISFAGAALESILGNQYQSGLIRKDEYAGCELISVKIKTKDGDLVKLKF